MDIKYRSVSFSSGWLVLDACLQDKLGIPRILHKEATYYVRLYSRWSSDGTNCTFIFIIGVHFCERRVENSNTNLNEWDIVVGDLRGTFASAPYRLLWLFRTTWPMSFYGGCKGIRVAKKARLRDESKVLMSSVCVLWDNSTISLRNFICQSKIL